MNPLTPETITINASPPTSQHLAEQRRSASAVLAQCAKIERRFLTFSVAAAFVGVAMLLWAWRAGLLDGFTLMAAVLFVGAVVGVGTLEGTLVFAAAGAVVLVFLGGGAGAFVGVGGGALVVAGALFHDNWIVDTRAAAQSLLSDLVELEYSDLPDECEDFVRMCEADSDVRAYQHQLAAMGRKPVLAEYNAAKLWVERSEHRLSAQEKSERARVACDRLAQPV